MEEATIENIPEEEGEMESNKPKAKKAVFRKSEDSAPTKLQGFFEEEEPFLAEPRRATRSKSKVQDVESKEFAPLANVRTRCGYPFVFLIQQGDKHPRYILARMNLAMILKLKARRSAKRLLRNEMEKFIKNQRRASTVMTNMMKTHSMKSMKRK